MSIDRIKRRRRLPWQSGTWYSHGSRRYLFKLIGVPRSLDELETEASPLVEAVWAVSNSPIAHVTGKGVTAAAQVCTLVLLRVVSRTAVPRVLLARLSSFCE